MRSTLPAGIPTQRKRRTPMRKLIIFILILIASAAYAVSYPPKFPQKHEEFAAIEGIKLKDAQGTFNPLSIPRSWKLISVSSGERSNSNNLWFQDPDGSVYLLQGFMYQDKLILHENVYKISGR
jgi:hypothetical protein